MSERELFSDGEPEGASFSDKEMTVLQTSCSDLETDDEDLAPISSQALP